MNNRGLAISFRGVSRSFGPLRALLPIDLEIGTGEFLTLLGPSGSGKTTLLNIAAGYLSPSAGRVLIGARDVTDLPPRRRNIGSLRTRHSGRRLRNFPTPCRWPGGPPGAPAPRSRRRAWMRR